jgi:hypothetical protein
MKLSKTLDKKRAKFEEHDDFMLSMIQNNKSGGNTGRNSPQNRNKNKR